MLLACLVASGHAFATEGGMGRPITGEQIGSGAGVIPPQPGWSVSIMPIYYEGSLGAERQLPEAGKLAADAHVKVSYNLVNLTRIWDTGAGSWNFASSIGLPLQYTGVSASVTGAGRTLAESDNSTKFSDIVVMPVAAGYHFSESDHLSLSLPIYVPTGAYDPNRLANAGLNVWTFVPTVAYSHLDASGGEFSLLGSIELNTRNPATNYQSGALFHLDALWTKAVAPGWTLGVVGGVIYQLSDDTGGLSDRLDGFRGRSIGAGPVAGWNGKWGKTPVSILARWVPEFAATNRPKGGSASISLTMPLF